MLQVSRICGCWTEEHLKGSVVARCPPRLLHRVEALSSTDVPHRLLAGLLAATTSLSADPAVLVLSCVALALLAASLAGGRADLKHLP